jgi:hypothetical protein
MPIYGAGQTWEPGKFAAILAIGDSWFWYPTNNLLEAFVAHPRVRDEYTNIQLLGFNGARLREYVDGKYSAEFRRNLRPDYSQYYSAVFISGAGNDAIAYHLALNEQCTGLSSAKACVDPAGMAALLASIGNDVSTLIDRISDAISRQQRNGPMAIFLHGYDYIVPDGRGFEFLPGIEIGPWLSTAMDHCHVLDDAAVRRDICRSLIDELNKVFARFDGQQGPGYQVHYINSLGTLDTGRHYKTDWANEIHPTPSGFDKVVDTKWISKIAGTFPSMLKP